MNTRRDYLLDHLREVPAFRALLRGVECRLFEQAGALEPPVLDVGCGDGHFASLAFEEPLFVGIDPEGAAVAEARARGAYHHPMTASATQMPFADGSFNTVVSNCVVEHIPDLEAALREIARVLASGGRFVFGVPSDRFADMLLGSEICRAVGLRRLGRAYGDWFNKHSFHFHTDGVETWRERMERIGFSLEHWEPYITPAGHRAFDIAHYLSVPRLITRKLAGRWVLFPRSPANFLFEKWLRPHYEAAPPKQGPYLFFHARKI